jgi:hypothetical protein
MVGGGGGGLGGGVRGKVESTRQRKRFDSCTSPGQKSRPRANIQENPAWRFGKIQVTTLQRRSGCGQSQHKQSLVDEARRGEMQCEMLDARVRVRVRVERRGEGVGAWEREYVCV